jgi:hypothetical protein
MILTIMKLFLRKIDHFLRKMILPKNLLLQSSVLRNSQLKNARFQSASYMFVGGEVLEPLAELYLILQEARFAYRNAVLRIHKINLTKEELKHENFIWQITSIIYADYRTYYYDGTCMFLFCIFEKLSGTNYCRK